MSSSTTPPLSIARQLQVSFRLISVIIAVALAIAVVTLALSVTVVGPQLNRAIDVDNADHDAHTAMLDQETGLRGYIFFGSDFLGPYAQGETALERANATLDREVIGDPTLQSFLLPARIAQQTWVINWADPAATGARPTNLPDMLALIEQGKTLFDRYRAPESALASEINIQLTDARFLQYLVLGLAATLETILFGVTMLVTARQHRRLRRDIVRPVDALLASMRSVRDGDLAAEVSASGPLELRQISSGLIEMTESLAKEHETRIKREGEAIHNAQRLQQILTLAREVAGSLNLRYVLRSVGTSAIVVSGYSKATVWLTDEDQNRLVAAYDSDGRDGAPMGIEPLVMGQGCAGKAAKYGRTASDEGGDSTSSGGDGGVSRLALPMIVGARVVGVLEVTDSEGRSADAPTVESLDALATHAGTAIEAARLHQKVEERSEHDALTRLFNRHRFEVDLAAECSRSLRYQRPLSFVMMDVDHFKNFNDEHGHQRGDEVLQEVSAVLAGELREGDTAYRYGGEEFAILLRETDAGHAAQVTERIRSRIAESLAAHGSHGGVTASFGVAGFSEALGTPDRLVRAADAALYQAKREGRNRVVSSEVPGAPGPVEGTVPALAVHNGHGVKRARAVRSPKSIVS
jgi:diguanylate cyclase (GGDEF)-like protein